MNQDKLEELEWEKEIAHKINAGDEKAFQEILNRYTSQVLNYIYRATGDKESAEELAQEVFVKLWRYKKKYKPSAKISTFLFKIAGNILIDYYRKNKKKPVILELDDRKYIEDNSSSNNNDKQEKIKMAMDSLPASQKQALVLKIYEGKNYKEISDIMDISKSSVESLLFRARQNIKKRLTANR